MSVQCPWSDCVHVRHLKIDNFTLLTLHYLSAVWRIAVQSFLLHTARGRTVSSRLDDVFYESFLSVIHNWRMIVLGDWVVSEWDWQRWKVIGPITPRFVLHGLVCVVVTLTRPTCVSCLTVWHAVTFHPTAGKLLRVYTRSYNVYG